MRYIGACQIFDLFNFYNSPKRTTGCVDISGDQNLINFPGTQMSSNAFADQSSDNDTFHDESSGNGFNVDDSCLHPSELDLEPLRQAFAKMVCTEQCSALTNGYPNFKNLASTMYPVVDLGDFDFLKDDCLKFYESEMMKFRRFLRNRDGKINLSVETLKSDAFDDYMCLTAHFVDDSWKNRKWVIGFQILDLESLAGATIKSLEYWGIVDKVFAITLNSDNFDAETLEFVTEYIQKKRKLHVNAKLLHVYCCAELLTSMVQDAFGAISLIIGKVQRLIVWRNTEPVWSITNQKLKEALDLQSKGQLAPEFVDRSCLLSAEEWKRVEGISKLVDKIHTVAQVLFHTKYPSASTFLRNLHDLHLSLKQELQNSCGYVSVIAERLLRHFDGYWENMFLVMAVAAVMDPRCKMAYIEYLCSKTEIINGKSQQSTVLETVRSLYGNYMTSTLQQDISESDSFSSDCEFGSSNSEGEELPNKKLRMRVAEYVGEGNSCHFNTSHLQDNQQFVQATSQSPPRSELDWYLEEPVLAWDQDFNLLNWWKTERPKYPTLFKMARDLLSIPFSVVTSHDAYYTEDRLVEERLLSSRISLMNALMSTPSWHQKH